MVLVLQVPAGSRNFFWHGGRVRAILATVGRLAGSWGGRLLGDIFGWLAGDLNWYSAVFGLSWGGLGVSRSCPESLRGPSRTTWKRPCAGSKPDAVLVLPLAVSTVPVQGFGVQVAALRAS